MGMTHEFGIMAEDPLPGERYDSYEPWEYNAISVHDDFIEPLMPHLNEIDMFWHTVDVPGKGAGLLWNYFDSTHGAPASVGDYPVCTRTETAV